jgi:mRNA-degrading endonuclease RelE of RelBE toxin-antitoxin system
MPFELIPSKLFLEKMNALDRSVIIELEKKLDKLKENPVLPAHRMHHPSNYFRVYLRNFRLVYKVEGNKAILLDILKRKEGYEKFRG